MSEHVSIPHTFRARATNTQLGQEETSPYTYLEVLGGDDDADVPPEIIVPPKDLQVTKGTGVTELQCIANAKPLYELETTWIKDGVPIDQAGVAFSFNDLWNRTLSLLQADFNHAGVYTCQVRMRTGGPRLKREALVEIIGKFPQKKTGHNHQITTNACRNLRKEGEGERWGLGGLVVELATPVFPSLPPFTPRIKIYTPRLSKERDKIFMASRAHP